MRTGQYLLKTCFRRKKTIEIYVTRGPVSSVNRYIVKRRNRWRRCCWKRSSLGYATLSGLMSMEMMMIQWMITIQERKKEEKTQNESDKNGCSLEKKRTKERNEVTKKIIWNKLKNVWNRKSFASSGREKREREREKNKIRKTELFANAELDLQFQNSSFEFIQNSWEWKIINWVI